MKYFRVQRICCLLFLIFIGCTPVLAAYNLEVPADSWEEYRLQFKTYSKHLLASYDRAFIDDYEGAIREVSKAIELLPEEGIGYAERGKYYRVLNNTELANGDFNRSLLLFGKAIERYRPDGDKKNKKSANRKVDPMEAARLIATLRYQRGEAYFSFGHYRQAADDFAAACQGGNAISCSRVWEVKAIEKRGINWAPISALQYYDQQRIERSPQDVVRVWVRREDSQVVRDGNVPGKYIQQRYELNCSTRESRLLEGFSSSGNRQTDLQKKPESDFSKPFPGSAANKLLTMLCPRILLK
ncbi:MAG: hypothetical protein GJV46_12250 [Geobacter sp.]|nr:hypothetical protein [Geobacter sp.]